jgi:sporulation protein YpjB
MKQLFVVVIAIFILFVHSNVTFANINSYQITNINGLADEAYRLAKSERYDETRKVLENIHQLLNNQYDLSADEIRILESSYNETMRVLDKEHYTNEEFIHKLTKLRLLIDAVATEYEPLWVEMEDSVLTAFQSVKDAYSLNDSQHFLSELNGFLSMYDVIYPSVMLDVPIERVQRVNAQIQFLEQNSSKLLGSMDGLEAIEALQTDLEALFNEPEEDEADPSLWWVIISTGGIIILTLSYVGWKKYKGEIARRNKYRKEQKY